MNGRLERSWRVSTKNGLDSGSEQASSSCGERRKTNVAFCLLVPLSEKDYSTRSHPGRASRSEYQEQKGRAG